MNIINSIYKIYFMYYIYMDWCATKMLQEIKCAALVKILKTTAPNNVMQYFFNNYIMLRPKHLRAMPGNSAIFPRFNPQRSKGTTRVNRINLLNGQIWKKIPLA